MAKNVRNFVNRAFMRTVDLDLLKQLLDPHTGQMSFDWDALPQEDAPRRDALFRLFRDEGERFPDALLDALHCILILSNTNGTKALQDVAEKAGAQLVPGHEAEGPNDGLHLNPRHLALRAYLHNREIFGKAVHRLAFFAPSPLRLVGAQSAVQPRHQDATARAAFRAAASVFFARRYQGRICEVHWYPEGDLVNLLVEHGMNPITTTVEQDGEQKVATIREMTQDTISYDVRHGTIKVSARADVEKRELVRLFAEHLIGNPEFFSRPGSDSLYTLARIQEAGRGWVFQNGWDEDLKDVVLKEIEVDEGEIGRPSRRGSPWSVKVWDNENALARLYELAPEIEIGSLRIEHIKLQMNFLFEGKIREILVTIRPKNTVSFRDHAFEARIFEHLRENGIWQPNEPGKTAAAAD